MFTDDKGDYMKLHNIQILIMRLAIAGLFFSISLEKYHEGWLTSSEHLLESLNGYHKEATGTQLTYLNTVAVPYVGLWTKLITIGELSLAVSLFTGLLVRFSAAAGIFMILNFHAANGNLFSLHFFGTPWGALLIAGLFVMLLARAGRWAGIDALLAKSNAKGMFW